MLVEVVTEIFRQNCYQIIPNINFGITGYSAYLAVPEPPTKRQEYFLLLEHDTIEDNIVRSLLQEDSARMFNHLAAADFTDESFAKNCTLILCCKCVDNSPISSEVILSLEEDAFNFKKNVISYTATELQSWQAHLKRPPTTSYLNELINADFGGRFRTYRNNGGREDGYYSLLMKVLAKVPIVHYLPPTKELVDLRLEIRRNLSDEQVRILDCLMELDLNESEEAVMEVITSNWSNNG